MKKRGNKKLRFLDRYFGIALIFFFSLFKRRREVPKEIASIALLKSSGIGDVVLLTAIIEDLKRAYPKTPITLYTGSSNAGMGRLIEGVEVVELPLMNPLAAIKILRKKRHTLFLECDFWPRISALLAYFSHARFTIGHRTEGQYRHFLYDRAVLHSHHCHQLENYRKLLEPLGIRPIHLPAIHIDNSGEKKRAFVLHLFCWGATAKLRLWPEKNWSDLIDFLLRESIEVILTGSLAERNDLERVRAGREGVKNLAGRLSLEETAKVLKQSLGLVTVDTGIMHLAAAIKLRVIALHGPSSEKRWGAIGPFVEIVTPEIACRPCLSLGFDSTCRHNRCMELITVEEVKNKVAQILKIDCF